MADFVARITRREVLIVGFDDPEKAAVLVSRARLLRPRLRIVGSAAVATDALRDAAKRARADDLLAPPFSLAALRGEPAPAVEPSTPSEPGSLTAFVPAQGGAGASTIALHMASSLARGSEGDRPPVLLVDFDFHSGATAFRLRLESYPTIVDALDWAGPDPFQGLKPASWEGVDVLAAPPPDAAALTERTASRVGEFFDIAKRRYAHIILDLPPALYASCRDALQRADAIYVVATPEPVSRHLAERRVTDLLDLGLSPDRLGFVVNRADSESPNGRPALDAPRGVSVVAEIGNYFAAANDALLRGRPVDPGSPLGRQYENLAGRISGGR